ncbi:type VI secretion system protein TssA [Mesorhizobium sp. PL10]
MAEIDAHLLLEDPRIAIGAALIGASSSGEDMRDDPQFEVLDTEFRKMETAGPAAVDWEFLNRTTLDVLEKRSKDLVLASRLTYGLFREEGYQGLAVGLSILQGMVSHHWEGLFPPLKRERGRAGSFDWMAEKLASAVEATPPAENKKLYALVAHDKLVGLDEFLSTKLQKNPVALGPLVRVLRPYAREARAALEAEANGQEEASRANAATKNAVAAPPEPAPSTPAAAPASAVKTARSAPPPPVVGDISVKDGTEKALLSIFAAAGKVATAVRQDAPSDPRGYLCARLAIWGQIRTSPPDNAGKSALPPPQKTRLAEIQALRSAGNHQGLLLSAEGAFVSSPFWLGAQFLVAQSMQALGADYDAACGAVVGQLCAFLKKAPRLVSLSFNDGMPFANGETLNWIASEIQSGEREGAGDSQMNKRKAEAGKLGQAGQILAGLKLLTEFAETRFGERERFRARLDVGEYCLRFELLQPLLALIASLRQTAEERALDVWEPQLAVALASLSWRSFTHKNASRFLDEREALERKAKVMATLAELDIVAAARLGSSAVS